ncbi:MAG: YybH family protein [Alphaproteobacteria bacterium]
MRVPFLFLAVFLLVLLQPPARADDAADRAALTALNRAYAEYWEKGDADALMALFTEDVTAVPHHGDAPVKGREALRAFWFPEGGPPTVVPEYRLRPGEIVVHGEMGVVRGRFRLVFEYQGTRTTIPEGNYVHIYRKTADGWKLRMLTWNDDPRDWVQEKVE